MGDSFLIYVAKSKHEGELRELEKDIQAIPETRSIFSTKHQECASQPRLHILIETHISLS